MGLLLTLALSGCSETKEKAEAATKHAAAVAATEGALVAFKANGAEKYKIVKSGNDNICEKCQAMDGKEFSIDEAVIGETAPPFHPNCGCSIAIVVEGPKRYSDGTVYALACATDGGSHGGELSQKEKEANARYIYDYLTAQGWTKNAIAGLLGNIQKESVMNPGAWEEYNNVVLGYGLVQWTKFEDNGKFLQQLYPELYGENPDKIARLVNDLAQTDPKKLMDLQLEFLIWSSQSTLPSDKCEWQKEIAHAYLDKYPLQHNTPSQMTWEEYISSTCDPGDLALIFHSHYERSGNGAKDLRDRFNYANEWYEYLNNLS